jgi:tetratricopeptide (TPR) repeat protein
VEAGGGEHSGGLPPQGRDGRGSGAEGALLEEQCDRAMELKNQGQYEEALAQFQEVIACQPSHARAHLGLGLVLCFVGRFDESLAELKTAVDCDPNWVDAHLNLAKTYAMLGMYDEARAGFNRVLELHPGHVEATKQLSYFEDLS